MCVFVLKHCVVLRVVVHANCSNPCTQKQRQPSERSQKGFQHRRPQESKAKSQDGWVDPPAASAVCAYSVVPDFDQAEPDLAGAVCSSVALLKASA